MYEDTKVQIFQKLSTSRRALLSALDDLDPEQWDLTVYTENADWSIRDLIGHLMYAEQSMIRLIELIKEGGEGAPADFDLNRFNASMVRKSSNLTVDQIRSVMITNRGRLLEMLNSMPDEDWRKKGRHGSMRIMTVEEILNQIADHENAHLVDILHVVGENQ